MPARSLPAQQERLPKRVGLVGYGDEPAVGADLVAEPHVRLARATPASVDLRLALSQLSRNHFHHSRAMPP